MLVGDPLCLTVKRVEPERIVVLTCQFLSHGASGDHRRRSPDKKSTGDSSLPVSGLAQPDGLAALKTCLGTHAPALSVREMDVFQDAVVGPLCGMSCAVRPDGLPVETHQK